MARAMTLGELRIEVARLDAEQVEEARQKMAKADAARTSWYTSLMGRGKEIDEALMAEGREHESAAVAALLTGDLSGAFAAWCASARTRVVRGQIRGHVHSGANITGLTPYTGADLNQSTGTFVEFLAWQEHNVIRGGVDERVREIVGVIPGTEE